MAHQNQEHEAEHDVNQTLEDDGVVDVLWKLEDLLDVDELSSPDDGHKQGNNHIRRTIGDALRKPEPKFDSALLGVQFEDLTYTVVKKQKINGKWESEEVGILQGIAGHGCKGQLTAIMGPSGSGKSTLLDALAGRIAEGSLAGTVRYDGQRMTRSYIRRNSAYVMQTDLLFPLLTVTETLLFSAEMRLPSEMPRAEKADRVQALLIQLGLEDCADTKVGDEKRRGISGGEKRRLSIGVDIIHGPSLLFLDEPTSGLDSTNALIVVEKLFDIAGTGSTVILTLHQPSYRIQQMLSRVIVLARGAVVYQGPPDHLEAYLETFGREVPTNMNSLEYFLDLIKEHEHYQEGLDPLMHFQRDRTTGSPPIQTLATALSKTTSPKDGEDDADGFDHSLTSLRSPLTPGIKLAKSFHRPSWMVIPRHNEAYFAANISPRISPSRIKSEFHNGIPIEAFQDLKSQSKPYSSVKGESEDEWEANGSGERYQNGWFREMILLMWRDYKNVIRTPELFMVKIAKAFFMSVVLATVFHTPKPNLDGVSKRLTYLLFLILIMIVSSSDALPTFIQDRYIFIREASSNAYRPSGYVVSTLLVHLPITFLHALIYVLITWWAIQLHGGLQGLCILVLICFISIVATNSLAMLVSAMVPNFVIGYSIMVGISALSLFLSGFLVPRSQIPHYYIWLHYLFTMTFALEAAVQNEFVKDECFSGERIPVVPGTLGTLARNTTIPNYPNCYLIGEDVIRAYDLTDFSVWGCIGMLLLWCFVYRLLLYIVLRYHTKSERK